MEADPTQGHSAGDDAQASSPPPRWLRELTEAAAAMQELARAQWQLFGAEWRVARSAAMTALAAALLAAVFALSLGLTVMALAAWLLAQWLGWAWGLGVLALLLVLCLFAALRLFRRCLHWMSLPRTRHHWRRMAVDLAARPPASKRKESTEHETASTSD